MLDCKKSQCSLVCPAGTNASGATKIKCKKGSWKGKLGNCVTSGGGGGSGGDIQPGSKCGYLDVRPTVAKNCRVTGTEKQYFTPECF